MCVFRSYHNARSLSGRSGWQSWLLAVITDLPRLEVMANKEPAKSIFAFTMNAFALIHIQYMLQSKDAAAIIKNSLKELHTFAGHVRALRASFFLCCGP